MIINESTHILVNALLGGMMGLLIWFSVELSVEELRKQVVKTSGAPHRTPDRDFWFGHVIQLQTIVIVGAFFGSSLEFRWIYFSLGFLAGVAACALVFSMARRQKFRIGIMDWLFD